MVHREWFRYMEKLGSWFFLQARYHINVKEYCSEVKGLTKKVGMNGALEILQIPLRATHHRGVDDAKNIAKILHWCLLNR